MKTFFSFFFLLFLVVIALVLQDTFSGNIGFCQIDLFLVPVVFCFGALTLSLPAALFFALITGMLEGLMTLSFHAHRAEIGITWFVFFFIAWAFLLQFVTALTGGIRWELHALGSALFTASLLAGEWILISWHRDSFSITSMTIFLIAIPSALSLLLAPLLYYGLQFLLPPSGKVAGNRL
ncbi:MAG: hypothetical protein K2W97_01945 [Chthoniobacterales bacterium]|nr:hypothetical protein [Chthoniobacterales bacterium]